MKRAVVLAIAWLWAASVAAQAAPAAVPEAVPVLASSSPRFSAGLGLDVIVGPKVELDGHATGDTPLSFMPIPGPTLVLRFDGPLHKHFMVGAQLGLVAWTTESEEALGFSAQYAVDASAVARFRIPLGRTRKHELLGSLAFGPSFGAASTPPRNYGESAEANLGWHVGPFASWQIFQRRVGFFVDAGFTYHRITHAIEYEIEGELVRDQITYQPIQVFLRGGVVLPLFL